MAAPTRVQKVQTATWDVGVVDTKSVTLTVTKDYPGRWAASGWYLSGQGVVESRRGNYPWRTRAAAAQHLAQVQKHDRCPTARARFIGGR